MKQFRLSNTNYAYNTKTYICICSNGKIPFLIVLLSSPPHTIYIFDFFLDFISVAWSLFSDWLSLGLVRFSSGKSYIWHWKFLNSIWRFEFFDDHNRNKWTRCQHFDRRKKIRKCALYQLFKRKLNKNIRID